jgi:hypothetical protein
VQEVAQASNCKPGLRLGHVLRAQSGRLAEHVTRSQVGECCALPQALPEASSGASPSHIYFIISTQSRVATLHLIIHELLVFLVVLIAIKVSASVRGGGAQTRDIGWR